jgi:hypothetical protein
MTSLEHEPVPLDLNPSFLWQTRDDLSNSAADVIAADSQSGKALPTDAVFKAVNSLYDDELRPNLGLVRRRLKELYDVLVPITDLRKLIQSLVKAKIISVQGDPQEPVLTLNCRQAGSFIDPMDPEEPYDAKIYKRMQVLMDAVAVSDPNRLYKGGRYGMAQQLRSVEMPELQQFSLGQVCHIVQHAIAKKIVGYKKGGALVPYQLSDSCLKNSAESADSSSVDLLPPIKTVAELRAVLMVLWMNPENHQGLPLSLVKDKIEQYTKRSLSEHLLGFGKLSHLFTIAELEGCCELRHDEPFQPVLCPPSLVIANGVSARKSPGKVVPAQGSPPSAANEAQAPAPTSDEPKQSAWAQQNASPPPMFGGPASLPAPMPPFPLLPHMPPHLPPHMPPWAPMLSGMTPMAVAMVKAHMESLGAGIDFTVPPLGKVPDGFSLDPEASITSPSLDPPQPCVPTYLQQDSEMMAEPSTDFIEALLADDLTPPPSFLADEDSREAMMPQNVPGAKKMKSQKGKETPEVLGSVLDSIDTAWYSNVDTPPLRPYPYRERRVKAG